MQQRGFSLIELVGVLAILAILTAFLFPKLSGKINRANIASTVNQAYIVETVAAVQAVQAAIAAHLAQFGSLSSQSGTPLNFDRTYDNFSQVLLAEGLVEKPFSVRLATNAFLRLVRVSGLSLDSAVDGSNGAYDQQGRGKNDVAGAAFVLEAVLPGVTEPEAHALNDQIDGPRLGATSGADDLLGRVIYRKAGLDNRTEVHIYITQGR